MFARSRIIVVLLALGVSASAAAQPSATSAAQPASAAAWNTRFATLAPGSTATADDVAIAHGIAVRNGVTLRDGTIDVDLPAPDRRGVQFAGIAFRIASTADYEIVYFRSSDDGMRWQEIQYQPVYEGETTWQLYPGPRYFATLPVSGDRHRLERGIHVRLVVAGARADVYVDSMQAPALRIAELKRAPIDGGVGVWAISPDSASTRFVGLRASGEVAAVPTAIAPDSTPAGQILRWRISTRLPSPDGVVAPRALTPASRAALDSGRVVEGERSGLVNLTALIGNPAGAQRVNVFRGAGFGMALARVTLVSDRPRTTRLRFGYSDGIAIFLNGHSIFAGRNDYDSRYKGYIASMSPDADAVDLPLAAGRNELVLVVTDKAFGWGFAARLEDPTGVRVTP